jgi:RNA polymerase sigma-70 factor (ECF subfamily)
MEDSTLLQIYQDNVHSLYEYVSRRCGGNRSLAEDVTQEVWLRAVAAWKKKRPPDKPMAWLRTVARNLLINYYRRIPPISLDSMPEGWDPAILDNGYRFDSPDVAVLVNRGLSRLRPSQARLLEAFHFDGLKVAEIASEFGLSERAVEGRLRRARIKLRHHLERMAGVKGGVS